VVAAGLPDMTTTIKFDLGGTLKFLVEPEARAGAMMTITHDGFSITAWGEDMAYKLATGMQVGVKVSYVDSKGHPAAIDGDVSWSSSDESIVTVTADAADSFAATVVGVGDNVGIAQVTASADADLGAGVRNILTTSDVEVVAGEAIAGTIAITGEATPVP
jgi:hypothetical protein